MKRKRISFFTIPSMDVCSWLFLVYGLVFLHWSQAVYFVLGNLARLGSLAVGLGCLVAAVCIRWRQSNPGGLLFLVFFAGYFSFIQALTMLQGHACWRSPKQIIFILMSALLFGIGYLLARGKRKTSPSTGHLSYLIMSGAAVVFLLAFLRYVQVISFHGAARNFGEVGLNPVGVAFAQTCLMLIFLVLGFLSRNVLYKIAFFMASALALFVVFSSASRGAIIWGGCTVGFLLVMCRKRHYFSPKALLLLVGAVLVALPVVLYLYNTNYAISERIDLLFERFESMYYELIGDSSTTDLAMSGRLEIWDFYFSHFTDWILLGERHYSGYYPHNQWLEILVRYGLFGIPLLFLSIYVFVRLCWDALTRRTVPDAEFTLIVALFMYAYLQSMSSLSMDMNRVLWLGFGYLVGYFQVKRARGSFDFDEAPVFRSGR